MSVTFDRERALSREEIGLMTADHPMVRNSIDLLLSGEAGNSAFGVWETPGPKSIVLEAYFIVECVAPASLQTDHYLSAVPVRVAVDHQGQDLTSEPALMKAVLRRGNHRKLLEQPKVTGEIVPEMLKVLTTLAGQQRVRIVEKALSGIRTELEAEKARLVDLAQLNPMIDDEELQKLDRYQEQVVKAVSNARLRLDSLRLIYRMPAP
jgi:ATP-dependent helicase HepA